MVSLKYLEDFLLELCDHRSRERRHDIGEVVASSVEVLCDMERPFLFFGQSAGIGASACEAAWLPLQRRRCLQDSAKKIRKCRSS